MPLILNYVLAVKFPKKYLSFPVLLDTQCFSQSVKVLVSLCHLIVGCKPLQGKVYIFITHHLI